MRDDDTAGSANGTEPTATQAAAFEHIIVPFDGTPDAQRAAVAGSDVATLLGAELVLATIGDVTGRIDGVLKKRAVSLSDERATMWVEPGHSAVGALGTMVRFRPRSLVCMYTHARTGVLHTVYGNLADQLLHELDVPLVLLGPRCREPRVAASHHLVVCLDSSEASGAAIELAARWASATATNATVVYGFDQDEIVVDIDERIAPLVAECPIVAKVAIPRPSLFEGVIDIVRHSTSSIIVRSWSPSAGHGRRRHDPLLSQLTLQSPVPILVQRPQAEGRKRP